ncbi:hypothetical protein DMR_09770 [Solidesulfovibrio magneticus RS-1]|uniref:Uncharacterized protein n=1 Tax=Solidesulfovibrio magneticus (strain ATCC 700980 / DSM 13731 / RS-1) TaxID=573370 RepID=C4XKS9_SOLM1|nr:hypothetical protein DMR_09770 [Solidesulfovibrio magneticus RS-1]
MLGHDQSQVVPVPPVGPVVVSVSHQPQLGKFTWCCCWRRKSSRITQDKSPVKLP